MSKEQENKETPEVDIVAETAKVINEKFSEVEQKFEQKITETNKQFEQKISEKDKEFSDKIVLDISNEISKLESKFRSGGEKVPQANEKFNEFHSWLKDVANNEKKSDKFIFKGKEFAANINTTDYSTLFGKQYDPNVTPIQETGNVFAPYMVTSNLTNYQLVIPSVSDSDDALIPGEGNAASTGSLDIPDRYLKAVRVTKRIKVTPEALKLSSPYSIQRIMQDDVTKKFGKVVTKLALSGSTTNQIYGVYNDPYALRYIQHNQSTSSFSPTYRDLDEMQTSFDASVEGNLMYVIDNTHWATLKHITGSDGELLYDKSDKTFNELPFIKVSNGILNPSTKTGDGTPYFCIVDPTNLWYADNGEIEVIVDPYTSDGYIYFTFRIYIAEGWRDLYTTAGYFASSSATA